MSDNEFGNDMSFDFEEPTMDRKPSESIPQDVLKGTLEGFQEDSIKDQAKEVASEAIPAIGLGDNYFELSKAKRSMDKTIRDSVTDIQLQAKPIIDVLKDVIPEKSFLRKYLRHAEDGGAGNGSTTEEVYDSSQFFKQAKEQKDLLLGTASAQVASQTTSTNKIVSMLNVTNEYNLSYYKKSLEYQYRLLGETTTSNTKQSALLVDTINILRSINKNVALPDFVKLKTSEAVTATLRQNVVSNLFNTNSVKSLGDTIGDNFKNYLQTKIASSSDVIEQVSELASAGRMASDAISDDDLKTMGTTRTRMLASTMLPELIRGYGGRKLGEYISKLPGMANYSERVNDAIGNSQETASNIRKGLEDKGKYRRAELVGFIEKMLSDKGGITNDFTSQIGSPDELRVFDTRVYDSITKVIPTYLSDIVESLNGIKKSYDFGTGKFVNKDVNSITHGFRQPLENSSEIGYLRALKDKGFTSEELVELARVAKTNSMPLSTTNAKDTDLSEEIKNKISNITEHTDIKAFNNSLKAVRVGGLKYGERIKEYYNSGFVDELVKANLIKENPVTGEFYTDEEGLNKFVGELYKDILDNKPVEQPLSITEKHRMAELADEIKRKERKEKDLAKKEKKKKRKALKRRVKKGKDKGLSKKELKALANKPLSRKELAEQTAIDALEEAKKAKSKVKSLYAELKEQEDIITALQQVKQDVKDKIGYTTPTLKFTTDKPNGFNTLKQNESTKPIGLSLLQQAKNKLNSISLTESIKQAKDKVVEKLKPTTPTLKFTTNKPSGFNTLKPIEDESDTSVLGVLMSIRDNLVDGNKTTKDALGLMNDLQQFNIFGIVSKGTHLGGSALTMAKTTVSERTPEFIKKRLHSGSEAVKNRVTSLGSKIRGIGRIPPTNYGFTTNKPNTVNPLAPVNEPKQVNPILSTLQAIKQRLTPENDADGNEKSILGKLIQTVKPKTVRVGSYLSIFKNRKESESVTPETVVREGTKKGKDMFKIAVMYGALTVLPAILTGIKVIGNAFRTVKNFLKPMGKAFDTVKGYLKPLGKAFASGGIMGKMLSYLSTGGVSDLAKKSLSYIGGKDMFKRIASSIGKVFIKALPFGGLASMAYDLFEPYVSKLISSDDEPKEHGKLARRRRNTHSDTDLYNNVPNTPRRRSRDNETLVTRTRYRRKDKMTMQKIDNTDKALLARIAQGEVNTTGDSGYDTVIGFGKYGKPPKPLTSMTLSEILTFQKQLLRNGSPSTAVGRYQMLKRTILEEAKYAGIPLSTVFTEDVQDTLILNRLKRMRGYDAYRKGNLPEKNFIRNLSQEFASVENPFTGHGYYSGQGVHTTAKQLHNALSGVTPFKDIGTSKDNGQINFKNNQTGVSTGNTQIDSLVTLTSGLTSFFGTSSNTPAIKAHAVSDVIPKPTNHQVKDNKPPVIDANVDTSKLEDVQHQTVDGIDKQTKEITTQTSVVKQNVDVNKQMLSELKELNKHIKENAKQSSHNDRYRQPEPLHPVN